MKMGDSLIFKDWDLMASLRLTHESHPYKVIWCYDKTWDYYGNSGYRVATELTRCPVYPLRLQLLPKLNILFRGFYHLP